MLLLFRKQRGLKIHLKEFNRLHFGNVSQRVQDASDKLACIQFQLLNAPSSDLVAKERDAITELLAYQKAEEGFLKQKARIRGITEGDQNTRFFHRSVTIRNSFNLVSQITDSDGHIISDPDLIVSEFISYYKLLLGTEDASVKPPAVKDLKNLLCRFITPAHCTLLCKPVTRDEVKSVMFHMSNDRSPGPDGYSAGFYKATWDIVGEDFASAIIEFFDSSNLISELNVTSLTLIPKVANPTQVRDFRPISCCNLFYKCIAKILASRMQLVLPDIISPSQSGFIKDRKIVDNVLLAQELVRTYSHAGVSPRCTIKVDLMKAFDSVHWGYLFNILEAMDFPAHFTGWLKSCVFSASYSISLNGGIHGFFPAKKGVRQGDPLSPYLFVIAIEGLSRLLDSAGISRALPYHPQCLKVRLTHLAFADDMMIFSNGSYYGLEVICDILSKFATWSGLRVNPDKCDIFSAGIPDCALASMKSLSGFRIGSLPVKYLGLPLIANKLRVRDCDLLIDKITKRIRGWNARTLSFAGRLQLVSSVLQSLAQYWMSVFLLPSGVIKKVQQFCCSYLWGGDDHSGQKAKVSWVDISFPKNEGGLGLRNLKIWNQALVFRLLWDIFASQGSIWVAWLRHYRIKGRDLATLSTGTGSWVWRRLLKYRTTFLSHFSLSDSELCWDSVPYDKLPLAVIWKTIRDTRPIVPWYSLIWGFGSIPRNSFLSWLVVQGRLTRRDRLIKWGIPAPPDCVLCKSGLAESHSHLFFLCSYSFEICSFIFGRVLAVQSGDMDVLFSDFCLAANSKTPKGVVCRAIWSSVIAHIWRERCGRTHGAMPRSSSDVIRDILREIAYFSLGNSAFSVAVSSSGLSLQF
ncbi:LINE-1 retrotransposable element ORF2 protein [Linum perenne]